MTPANALHLEALETRDTPTTIAAAIPMADVSTRTLATDRGPRIELSATTEPAGPVVVTQPVVTHAVPLVQQARPRFAVASAAGVATVVNVYDGPTNALLTVLTPFGRNYNGGASVAVGDVTGDGVPDVVVGKGDAPTVKVFDGVTLLPVREFAAFGAGHHGVAVALGDVTGVGHNEIVAASGGPGAQVAVFDVAARSIKPAATYLAGDTDFMGGVSVAVADVTGDGRADVVAGSATSSRVVVIDGRSGATAQDFRAYGESVRGVSVAAGDFGDGRGHVVTAAVGQTVRSFDDGKLTAEFRPLDGDAGFVAVRDLTGNGVASLIVGSGAGKPPHVVVVNGLTGKGLRDFPAMTPNYATGLHVG